MIAIGTRYLCGWAMATHPADRNRAEWPPHPDRVFMALAAAHFETGEEVGERDVLEWLESQDHLPVVIATDHSARSVVTSYVPVNDASMTRWKAGKGPSADQIKAGLGLLPENRSRQPRTFPVAIPDDDTVWLVWREAQASEAHRAALASLCRKVTYLGHSASLVQMWVETDERTADVLDAPAGRRILEPTTALAKCRLRVSGVGRLADLREAFAAEPRQRPTPGLWMGYSDAAHAELTAKHGTVFASDLIVLRMRSGDNARRFGLESTLLVTSALRKRLVNICGEAVPEWLSGKCADGTKSESPHIAFLPLAYVGHKHADGHLLGIGLALPRSISSAEQRETLGRILLDSEAMPAPIRLEFDDLLGALTLELDDRDAIERPVALRPEVWTESPGGLPSMVWATVTPIVLDRHPKSLEDTAEIIAAACERVTAVNGQPGIRPVALEIQPVSKFVGSGHARRDFPRMPSQFGKIVRCHTHALIEFDAPVYGPLVLGAGRYLGYGLCRPWSSQENER